MPEIDLDIEIFFRYFASKKANKLRFCCCVVELLCRTAYLMVVISFMGIEIYHSDVEKYLCFYIETVGND